MRLILIPVLILLLSKATMAEDRPTDDKLCSIKTVFIEGHGSNAQWYRDNLEEKTWLTVEPVMENADAIFRVGGVGSTVFPIKAQLIRRNQTEYLWEESSRQNPFKAWAGDARTGLLKKLNKAANCK